ncbi:helix-turn-helix transcriptional regulator [Streptomyces tendae]|uniref:helix-turn-helix transcriptional regulator n=1 Tax=Streptomyces tendae TaxID=1932 RepID=UPI0036814CD3
MIDDLQLLTPAEVGALLGVTEKTLAEYRWKGTGPRFIKLGGNHRSAPVRYPRAQLQEWLNSQPAGGGRR